jgi:AcrR family transcriptional regulator
MPAQSATQGLERSGVYGGISAEARRAERRGRLMAAGLDLIAAQGWASTTVRGVCRTAGLSSRFFYESFADLDALAVAIFDDVTEAILTAAFGGLSPTATIPDTIRTTVEVLVQEYTRDPRLARFVFVEALGSEPLMRRRLGSMRRVAEVIAEVMRNGDTKRPEGDSYVDVVAAVLSGGFVELMIGYLRDELDLTKEQLIEDFATLAVSTWETTAQTRSRRLTGPAGSSRTGTGRRGRVHADRCPARE